MKKLFQNQRGFNAVGAVIALIAIIVVAGVAYAIVNNNSGSGNGIADDAKVFNIESKPYSFTPNEIRVKKGDLVGIILTNIEGFHDLKIDEFNVATKQIAAGQTDTVEFVADKAGTFEFYCSVGNHRQMGMVGKLIIEE